jgi:hypothetical protein
MFKIGGDVSDRFEPLFYLRGIRETCPDSPPNPCNPVREREAIC